MIAETVLIDTELDLPLWLSIVAWRSYGELLAPDEHAWLASTVALRSVNAASDPPQPFTDSRIATTPQSRHRAKGFRFGINGASHAPWRSRPPSVR